MPVNKRRGRRWIVDSGTCRHLIAEEDLLGWEKHLQFALKNPLVLTTANGIINADQGALVEVPVIGKVEATVLDNTPAALSLGTLIMDEGYDWLCTRTNRNRPILIDPDYQAITMDVENKVPMLDTRSLGTQNHVTRIKEYGDVLSTLQEVDQWATVAIAQIEQKMADEVIWDKEAEKHFTRARTTPHFLPT